MANSQERKLLKWICHQIARPNTVLNALLKTVYTTPKTIPALRVKLRLVIALLVPAVKHVATHLKQDSKFATISDSSSESDIIFTLFSNNYKQPHTYPFYHKYL